MYRTKSLVHYFPRLSFLNFIFSFILSCFFLCLKVYANEAECKQWHHKRFAYIEQSYQNFSNLSGKSRFLTIKQIHAEVSLFPLVFCGGMRDLCSQGRTYMIVQAAWTKGWHLLRRKLVRIVCTYNCREFVIFKSKTFGSISFKKLFKT